MMQGEAGQKGTFNQRGKDASLLLYESGEEAGVNYLEGERAEDVDKFNFPTL